MRATPTDNELAAFCEWFARFHGASAEATVFTTCLCGRFHTFSKAASLMLKRCKELKILTVYRGRVTIVNNNKKTTKGDM